MADISIAYAATRVCYAMSAYAISVPCPYAYVSYDHSGLPGGETALQTHIRRPNVLKALLNGGADARLGTPEGATQYTRCAVLLRCYQVRHRVVPPTRGVVRAERSRALVCGTDLARYYGIET
eukprot:3910666-Rhodomonas_salina.2